MKIWSVSVVMCLVLALGCSTPPKTVTSNESFAITLTHPLHLGGHEYRTISPADVPKLRQLAVTNMWESNLAVAADTLTLTDPNIRSRCDVTHRPRQWTDYRNGGWQ